MGGAGGFAMCSKKDNAGAQTYGKTDVREQRPAPAHVVKS
jgi:hypothetical protein